MLFDYYIQFNMDDLCFLPPPPEDPRPPEKDLCRLWIGNLDSKLTEYSLLKMLQQTGVTLKHYDFLYHKAGPEKGKPRGYCFITVAKPDEAVQVVKSLDGKLALSRRLVVRLANADCKVGEPSKKLLSSENATSYSLQPSSNTQSKIKAIEAKLRMMEENSDVSAFLSAPVSALAPVISSNSDSTRGGSSYGENNRRQDYRRRDNRPRRSRAPYSRHRTRWTCLLQLLYVDLEVFICSCATCCGCWRLYGHRMASLKSASTNWSPPLCLFWPLV